VAATEAAAPDQDQIGSLNPLTNLIAPRHSSPTQKQGKIVCWTPEKVGFFLKPQKKYLCHDALQFNGN
jgi:hypothetical protein